MKEEDNKNPHEPVNIWQIQKDGEVRYVAALRIYEGETPSEDLFVQWCRVPGKKNIYRLFDRWMRSFNTERQAEVEAYSWLSYVRYFDGRPPLRDRGELD